VALVVAGSSPVTHPKKLQLKLRPPGGRGRTYSHSDCSGLSAGRWSIFEKIVDQVNFIGDVYAIITIQVPGLDGIRRIT
jgi:hypothetical protein